MRGRSNHRSIRAGTARFAAGTHNFAFRGNKGQRVQGVNGVLNGHGWIAIPSGLVEDLQHLRWTGTFSVCLGIY